MVARPVSSWTEEARGIAVDLVRHAATCRAEAARRQAEATRALAYFLNCAQAHGMTTAELTAASGLGADEVLALTDPAVNG
jgi:hypothetical protein